VRLLSRWRLPWTGLLDPGAAEVELVQGRAALFAEASRLADAAAPEPRWFRRLGLADGSTYLRWSGLFEFLISPDGRRIVGRALEASNREIFHTYLLGQVLSFALLRRGIEPLHATAVVVDGRAVAFLGDSGYGKSSLAAAFVRAGYPLLTDDLLVLHETDDSYTAHPGPPRLKLFPAVAQRLLGDSVRGTRMNPLTNKLIIPLPRRSAHLGPAPLHAVYVLNAPSRRSPTRRVTIRAMAQRRAFVALLANTFNNVVTEPERLRRHFRLATRLAADLRIKSLSYPRDLDRVSEVREAVCADLDR
jgi:hypothetical protein